MNARNARRIRLGINLAKTDIAAIRLNLTPVGGVVPLHPLTEQAWLRTLTTQSRASMARVRRHMRETS